MARSLLCPDAFLSPLEIDAAVSRALAEDLGRAGDITATATIPEDTPARAIVVARAAGVISGLPLVRRGFRQARARDRDRSQCARRVRRRREDRAHGGRGSRPRRPFRRTSGAQPARPSLGSGDGDARIRAPRRGHAHAHLLHAQDDAGPARPGKVAPSAAAAVSTTASAFDDAHADQRQPHRRRRRHRRGAQARKGRRRPSGQDRDRGRYARSAARGARGRVSRRGAARQHGRGDHAQGGGKWSAASFRSRPRAASPSTPSPKSPRRGSTTPPRGGSPIRRPSSTSRLDIEM